MQSHTFPEPASHLSYAIVDEAVGLFLLVAEGEQALLRGYCGVCKVHQACGVLVSGGQRQLQGFPGGSALRYDVVHGLQEAPPDGHNVLFLHP